MVPILFDAERLSGRGDGRASARARWCVVSVGRLAPNKRHDLVLAAFAAFQREHAPDARLTVVGEPITPVLRRADRAGARAGRA